MGQNTSLAPRGLTPAVWGMLTQVGDVLYRSRLFGVNSAEAAIAIALRGLELGLAITTAFEFITVIQGRPQLSPRGALALIYQSGELAEIKFNRLADDSGKFAGYAVRMRRRNGVEHTASFRLEDARRANLIRPGSAWESYPENMCLWRAVGFCADVVFPDAYGVGLSESGDVIEGQWSTPDAPSKTPSLPQAAPTVDLHDLVARFGAEAVLLANGGQFPASESELAAIAARLEAPNA
jgi:hypothetical protein